MVRRKSSAARGYDYRWETLSRRFRALWPCCVLCVVRGVRAAPDRPVCDHIEPHKMRDNLRLRVDNLQTLCKSHHDTEKRRVEQMPGAARQNWVDYLREQVEAHNTDREALRALIPSHILEAIQ